MNREWSDYFKAREEREKERELRKVGGALVMLAAIIGGFPALGAMTTALFDSDASDNVIIAVKVLFVIGGCISFFCMIKNITDSYRSEDDHKGKKIGLEVLQMSIMLPSAVIVGIALFNRSHTINGWVLIAAELLFVGVLALSIIKFIHLDPPEIEPPSTVSGILIDFKPSWSSVNSQCSEKNHMR